jgi:hypothetical protein
MSQKECSKQMRMAKYIMMRNQNHRRKDVGDQTYKSIQRWPLYKWKSMSGKK